MAYSRDIGAQCDLCEKAATVEVLNAQHLVDGHYCRDCGKKRVEWLEQHEAKPHRYHDEILYGRWKLHSLFRVQGIWYGRVRDLATGQIHKRSSRERDHRKARQVIVAWIDEQATARDEATAIRLKAAMTEWISLKTLRPKSKVNMDSAQRVFVKALGDCDVASILPKHIEQFLKSLIESGHTPDTRNKYLAILRSFFVWARRQHYCDGNPTDGMKPLRLRKQVRGVLTIEEAQKLLDVASRQKVIAITEKSGRKYQKRLVPPEHLWLGLLLSLYTGLRKKNVLGLRWSQIDLDKMRIDISAKEMKADDDHSLPIHPELAEILRAVLRERGECEPNARVLGWDIVEIKACFKQALEEAGLVGKIRWHDLRHTFSTWLAPLVPWAVLQRLLAHHPPDITWDYIHLPWGELEGAIRKLPNLLGLGKTGQAMAIVGRFRLQKEARGG